jgi:Family of unknown function (DUF6151)
MSHPIQCRCGTLQGAIADARDVNRVVCYCRDCQAFAYFLGRAADVLDERGGSDIVQTLPRKLSFTRGQEALACMRLTPKGLLRWYARCCNTPIGNTLATPRVSFIGLLHSCLESDGKPLDEVFGPVRAWVNTKSARGEPKPKVVGMGTAASWFVKTTLRARFNGDYSRTPLFHTDTGTPITSPRVLTEVEHAHVMSAVRAAL